MNVSDINWIEFVFGVTFAYICMVIVTKTRSYIRKAKVNDIGRKWMRLCKCGHPESTHNGSSGPYSSGRYHHRECTHGSKSFPPYRSGGCRCYEYKRLFFPRYRSVT